MTTVVLVANLEMRRVDEALSSSFPKTTFAHAILSSNKLEDTVLRLLVHPSAEATLLVKTLALRSTGETPMEPATSKNTILATRATTVRLPRKAQRPSSLHRRLR